MASLNPAKKGALTAAVVDVALLANSILRHRSCVSPTNLFSVEIVVPAPVAEVQKQEAPSRPAARPGSLAFFMKPVRLWRKDF